MSPKFPRLKPDEVIRILRRHGFVLVASKGSHQKWRNPLTDRQVTVPYHKARQLPLGTLKSIIEGSAVPLENWRDR